MKVVVLTADRPGCGIREYVNHLYPDVDSSNSVLCVKKQWFGILSCLKIPFTGADILDFHHEYSFFGFAGFWALPLLLYLQLFRLFGGKIVVTMHTVYDWNQVEQLFAHRTNSRLLLRLLHYYGLAYNRLLLAFATRLLFLNDSGKAVFQRVSPGAVLYG